MRTRTRVCSFELDPLGFVRAIIDPGAEMTVDDARDAVTETARIGRGVRRPILVDMRQVKSQTREAREHFAGDDVVAMASSVAILVQSPVSRVIGNFFLRQSIPRTPNRLFTDESDAIEWLLSHTQ